MEPIPRARGERIVRLVLARGSLIALEVDYQLDLFPQCWLVDPRTPNVSSDDALRTSIQTPHTEMDAALVRVTSQFPSVRAVVVEDEYALRSDPVGKYPCAFADERVIRWRSIEEDATDAASLLRPGSHGVPLCGYLTTRSPTDLGLRPSADLSAQQMAMIANSAIAVVSPLLDTDSLIVLSR